MQLLTISLTTDPTHRTSSDHVPKQQAQVVDEDIELSQHSSEIDKGAFFEHVLHSFAPQREEHSTPILPDNHAPLEEKFEEKQANDLTAPSEIRDVSINLKTVDTPLGLVPDEFTAHVRVPSSERSNAAGFSNNAGKISSNSSQDFSSTLSSVSNVGERAAPAATSINKEPVEYPINQVQRLDVIDELPPSNSPASTRSVRSDLSFPTSNPMHINSSNIPTEHAVIQPAYPKHPLETMIAAHAPPRSSPSETSDELLMSNKQTQENKGLTDAAFTQRPTSTLKQDVIQPEFLSKQGHIKADTDSRGKETSFDWERPNRETHSKIVPPALNSPQQTVASLSIETDLAPNTPKSNNLPSDLITLDQGNRSGSINQGNSNHSPTNVSLRSDIPTQVLHHIATALHRASDRSIEIALNPPELGRLRMVMTASDTGMVVQVLADRVETLDLARRNIDGLGSALEDLGYEDLSFAFGQNDHHDEQQKPSEENKTDNLKLNLAETPPPPSMMASQHGAENEIDIRI